MTTSEITAQLEPAAGALYLAMLFLGFINSMSVQAPVAYERAVSYRETAAGMYSPLPFGLAACTVELPYIFVQASCFCRASPTSQ